MIEPAAVPPAEPDGAPRIAGLDVLRGIAILGILFMNINSMGGSMRAGHEFPQWIGQWTPLDRTAWFARQILADGTARCMLELLFGAGMVILTGRGDGTTAWWRTMRAYYWRNIVLFGFGMAHVFLLLWPGDILHIYAVCALIVFPLRKLPPQWLITFGLMFALTNVVLGGRGTYSVLRENILVASAQQHHAARTLLSPDERKAERSNHSWHRQVRREHMAILREDTARKTDWRHWRAAMVVLYVDRLPTTPFEWFFRFGEAAFTMLIGAGLFKLGILQMARGRGFYARMLIVGYLVGGTIRAVAAWQLSRFDDGVSVDWSLSETGRLAMTLGHVGLVGTLLATARGAALLRPFATAGRTALSIYICQTLICLWLLYPPFALGLYGKQGWAALMATAFVVDSLLLVAANLYLRRYRIAPVEWAWRSIAALRPLPFRSA